MHTPPAPARRIDGRRPWSVVLAAAAVAACNSSQQGGNDLLRFTPITCGNPLLGCSFDQPIASDGRLSVQIASVDRFPTAGLDLATSNPAILAVTRAADVAGQPTWDLHGGIAGGVTLSAKDGTTEVDFIDVSVAAPTRLGLVNIVGDAVGPTNETGVDQAWTINADQLVSFQVLSYATNTHLMGRLAYVAVLPSGSMLLANEQSSSDRPQGYLYVQPAAGDYPFRFELAATSRIAVDAILHAR